MASDDDPLQDGVERAYALVKSGAKAILPSERTADGVRAKAEAVMRFLDS
jgi:hypothetical protein